MVERWTTEASYNSDGSARVLVSKGAKGSVFSGTPEEIDRKVSMSTDSEIVVLMGGLVLMTDAALMIMRESARKVVQGRIYWRNLALALTEGVTGLFLIQRGVATIVRDDAVHQQLIADGKIRDPL